MVASDAQNEVIAFLSEPASHGARGAVERIDTHASILFLVGERALKLKRAVVFPYLDYSRPQLRAAACRRELELNRRTAPALYLGVQAICRGADGTIGFDIAGDPLDWVVVMRRFDQTCLFDHLAETGRLTPRLMRDLAESIVALHEAAERDQSRGDRASWEALIEDNGRNLLQRPCLDPAAVRHLTHRSHKALAAVAELLESRRRRGKVRRCHGDLHLRNICLFQGQPTLFDAVEFNDSIACIDCLYDLAFLLMDLEHRGQRDLASLVLNNYLDRADEQDGLAALPLFLSLRAAIRAHVAMAKTGDLKSKDEARSYFALAQSLLDTAPPCLVAIGGVSGSGKSVLAAALAPWCGPAPGARVIRSDVVRKWLAGAIPEAHLGPEAYQTAMNQHVYRTMREQAEIVLASGYTAILDATFRDSRERQAVAELARAAKVPFYGLWLEAPGPILATRIAARSNDASDADLAILGRQLASNPSAPEWHCIDAGGDPGSSLAAARAVVCRATGRSDK